MSLAVTIIILLVTLIIGVPIPFCFGAAFINLVVSGGYQTDFLLSTGYTLGNCETQNTA